VITKLNVYLTQTNTQKVGILAQKNGKIYFEYDKDFLKTNLEISPFKLPLKQGVFVCEDNTFNGLWGVFADSLPDGWGRLIIDRHLMSLGINPATLSMLDRLSYVGGYGMGALSYIPSNETKNSIDNIILDDLATNSAKILEGSSDIIVDELLSLNGSSAGARPKVLVQISKDYKTIIHGKQKLQNGFSHYIVKFASHIDSQEIGAIEYAYSLMAKEAKLKMPKTALLDGKKGRYFAIERFDRVGDKRVHMHSAAGLIHTDFRLPTLDYSDLLTLTMHLTKNMQDIQEVFRLACFNLFTHNRDDHAKNFSFLMDEQGKWKFSPVYDITFSNGPGGEHSTMYMGEGKNPTTKHLMALAKKHNIKNADDIIKEVLNAKNRWREFAVKAGVSKKTQESIWSVISKY
jgi:serine/threonine-protein kinase HipA